MFRHQDAFFMEFINNNIQHVIQELVALTSITKIAFKC
jgi:hypothetical protein